MNNRLRFVIAGVQKGGTTALDHFLRRHPSVQMARAKESHFFDDESLNWDAPNYENLHRLFDLNIGDTIVRGEATPVTIYWPSALERLHAYNPSIKLIVGLRHPSFRAFSQWRMETKRGAEKLPFDDAIGFLGRQRVWLAPNGVHRLYSYIERSLYAEQIAKTLSLFPREQVFFYRTDRLWTQPAEVLGEIQDFLQLERQMACKREYIVPIESSDLGKIPTRSRARLDQAFEQTIKRTARLTGMDLSDWMSDQYEEPMTAAAQSAHGSGRPMELCLTGAC